MNTISVKDTIINNIKKTLVPCEWKPFILGDINNDKISDTAFVFTPAYYATIDTSISLEPLLDSCINNQCYNRVKFSCKLPEIYIENSIWGFVEKIDDLDEDGINEIIFQTNWYIGTHVEIYIYSFFNGKWVVLAKNNRYEEDSYKNLITKIDKRKFKFRIEYFNKHKHDLMNKTITVKIKKEL
jgi:hypothetical protein